MKTRTLIAALVALAGVCACLHGVGVGGIGNPSAPVSWSETQPASRAPFTSACDCDAGNSNQGLCLNGLVDMHAVVACSDGSQFTAGYAQAYFCDPRFGRSWSKANPAVNDFALPTSTAQLADAGYMPGVGPELQVLYPFGRFAYANDGGACNGAAWDGGILVNLSGAQQ